MQMSTLLSILGSRYSVFIHIHFPRRRLSDYSWCLTYDSAHAPRRRSPYPIPRINVEDVGALPYEDILEHTERPIITAVSPDQSSLFLLSVNRWSAADVSAADRDTRLHALGDVGHCTYLNGRCLSLDGGVGGFESVRRSKTDMVCGRRRDASAGVDRRDQLGQVTTTAIVTALGTAAPVVRLR
jgi:hypothetical protein